MAGIGATVGLPESALDALSSALLSRAPEPYALILADPARGALVLARNGDGPPLYYAETAGGILAASEPGALLAAGVPAEPDEGVVGRFITTQRL
jgi:asparagine synthetase B (glutamine-hydrolysing)